MICPAVLMQYSNAKQIVYIGHLKYSGSLRQEIDEESMAKGG